MPYGDGTGPLGKGPGTGGKSGGAGRGRIGGNRSGAGPVGNCICPVCGASVSHKLGLPCSSTTCANCGAKMTRG
jgi:uncharacterized protein